MTDEKTPLSPVIQKSLDASVKEGVCASVMLNITDYYLIPLALFMKALPREIGLLVAIPHLLASVSQLFAVDLIRVFRSRLRFLTHGSAIQAASLIPLALLPWFDIPGRLAIVIISVILLRVLGSFIGTAWGSLISDTVPTQQRGHYLGWRSQITGVAGLLGLGIAGIFLSQTENRWPALGFFLVFLTASIARFASAWLMSHMVDRPYHFDRHGDFTFFQFLIRFRESNFVKFVLFVASVTFATQLASPYFSVFMIGHLNLNYWEYTAVHFVSVIGSLIAFPLWGRHADHVGNAKVLNVTSFLIPAIPLLWLFSGNSFYLMAINFASGFIWAGFNLCATNFIFDAVTPAKRVRCLGYFNLINGVALFSGSMLGGYLVEILPTLFGNSFFTLFVISAMLRFAAHFILSRHFTEVRPAIQPISSTKLCLSVVGILPMFGPNREWSVFPLVKKPK